jgi:hypothetical protein
MFPIWHQLFMFFVGYKSHSLSLYTVPSFTSCPFAVKVWMLKHSESIYPIILNVRTSFGSFDNSVVLTVGSIYSDQSRFPTSLIAVFALFVNK